ncbi:MAG: multifunctional CCA addition/repair protein [Aestuariibacter sp.]
MEIYLVGGAVRDALLQRPVKDRDWVVVGATPQEMLDKGFKQVGADFPVFLHPKSHEEYALARTERKTGVGYSGFSTHSAPDVTLEDDLRRRDLTINAMAQREDKTIIDPFGGQQDLNNRVLRHVSDAFIEDPLRVLRVARFAARYAQYGFTLAPETQMLMQHIAKSGEMQHLAAERVWQETARALQEPAPQVYFEVLRKCHALKDWFPELEALWGVPNPPKWHPEIDTGIHTMMVLEQAAAITNKLTIRFAALSHDLGKGITPESEWPSHRGHEHYGLPLVKDLCQRLKAPNDCKELAELTCKYHTKVHGCFAMKASTVVRLFDDCDAWRRTERFYDFLLACEADARGRTGFELRPYPQAEFLKEALQACLKIDVQTIIAKGFKGADIKVQLTQLRTECVTQVKQHIEK